MPQKLGHNGLDALVGDGLFGLVLIRRAVRKRGENQNQAVLDVVERDAALVLVVLVRLLEVGINLRHKGAARRLFRRAAVLQPAGIVVILHRGVPVRERDRSADFHVVLGFVRPVAGLLLRMPELHGGQGVVPGDFLRVVDDPFAVQELRDLKARLGLVAERKAEARVHNRLPPQGVKIIFGRDVDIRKHLQVGLPVDSGPRVFAGIRLFFQAAAVFPVLKMEPVAHPVAADIDVHILRRVLRGAQAEAVQPERVLVALVGVVVVFSAGVQLAEHQLPVIAFLRVVELDRNAPAVVLDLHRIVRIARHDDSAAEALARLVDGIRDDLKNGVLAALDAVGAENHRRAPPHPVGALQSRDTLVAVFSFQRLTSPSRKIRATGKETAKRE